MGNICAVSEKQLQDQLFSVVLLSSRFDQICNGLTSTEKDYLRPKNMADLLSITDEINYTYRDDYYQKYYLIDPEKERIRKLNKLTRDYLRKNVLNTEDNTCKFLLEIAQKLALFKDLL